MADPDQTESDTEERLALALKALSVVRHDLRNLLASVTIMADRMEASGDERLAKAAPLLVASMERAVTLGVRAGTLADARAGDPTRVPLSRALAAADPEGSVDAAGTDAVVLCDEGQLAAVLEELLANAHAAGGPVRVEAARAGGTVEVRVSDGGGGIPDYARADLFTPFKGAKRRGGAGLGLPIGARLARLNGGALALEETGEAGSTFLLTLPAG